MCNRTVFNQITISWTWTLFSGIVEIIIFNQHLTYSWSDYTLASMVRLSNTLGIEDRFLNVVNANFLRRWKQWVQTRNKSSSRSLLRMQHWSCYREASTIDRTVPIPWKRTRQEHGKRPRFFDKIHMSTNSLLMMYGRSIPIAMILFPTNMGRITMRLRYKDQLQPRFRTQIKKVNFFKQLQTKRR